MSEFVVVSKAEIDAQHQHIERLRAQRNLAFTSLAFAVAGLIAACALFGPPAYQQEQQRRTESVRLTLTR